MDDPTVVIYNRHKFIIQAKGFDLIKPFWPIFTHDFSKLDHLTNVTIIFYIAKRYSFRNRVSKFIPKKFYEIDPTCLPTEKNSKLLYQARKH